MHALAAVYCALGRLTNLDRSSYDAQHVDLSHARKQRDFRDMAQMINWFECNNPFDITDCRLRNLFSGPVATDGDEVMFNLLTYFRLSFFPAYAEF